MRCHEAREALTGGRYGQRPSPEVDAHVRHCGFCRSFVADSDALDQVLAADPNESARPGFDTRFFARLDANKKKPVPWWRSRRVALGLLGTMATAAILIIRASDPLPTDPTPEDLALAMHLDMLQTDVLLLQQLDALEDMVLLAQLGPEDIDALLNTAPLDEVPQEGR